MGARFLELCMAREKPGKRETKLVAMLQYVNTNMWKTLFGRKADGLEKSKDREHTCGCHPAPLRPRLYWLLQFVCVCSCVCWTRFTATPVVS